MCCTGLQPSVGIHRRLTEQVPQRSGDALRGTTLSWNYESKICLFSLVWVFFLKFGWFKLQLSIMNYFKKNETDYGNKDVKSFSIWFLGLAIYCLQQSYTSPSFWDDVWVFQFFSKQGLLQKFGFFYIRTSLLAFSPFGLKMKMLALFFKKNKETDYHSYFTQLASSQHFCWENK